MIVQIAQKKRCRIVKFVQTLKCDGAILRYVKTPQYIL